ncbi:MAG: helix-turn-helix domain-containing protein [bacterium]
MSTRSTPRYCRCGTRLGLDNPGDRCSPCEKKQSTLRAQAPEVPAGFWHTAQFRDAFSVQHIGRISRTYRKHERHVALYGRDGISQELVGHWLGLTQAQVSRIENGPPVRDLDSLAHWARTLRIPDHLLWFKPLDERTDPATSRPAEEHTLARVDAALSQQEDDVNRRELLRIMSMSGTLIAMSPVEQLDWEQLGTSGKRATRQAGAGLVRQYAALNTELWQVYTRSRSKRTAFPLVREQLNVLTTSLQRSNNLATHRRLYELTSELYQLAGEILFDGNHYTDAAQCYTLAALASKEAESYDLWGAALIRHSFLSLYGRQLDKAASMLELAGNFARRGDSSLSTRHWAYAVQAQAFAGLAETDACRRALDAAEGVLDLNSKVHNGGWLRFHGDRLAEESGSCYIWLRRPDLAETALTAALAHGISPRRLASVHVDLATLGLQRRDLAQAEAQANVAMDVMRRTGSGFVKLKLQGLQAQLVPLSSDGRARQLHQQITTAINPVTQ